MFTKLKSRLAESTNNSGLEKYRVDFEKFEIEILMRLLEDVKKSESSKIVFDKLNEARIIAYSSNKASATDNAIETRVKNAKAKIKSVVVALRATSPDRKITSKEIAEKSGCSINTVRKYRDLF